MKHVIFRLPAALRAFFRLPACRALLIQLVSLLPALVVAAGIQMLLAIQISLIPIALVHGFLASALSWRLGLAPWWWLIQLGFPVALVGTLQLSIPPVFFLLSFIVLLALYWTTFRTQVPFFPSGSATHSQVLRLLPEARSIRFIDIGSGLGDLVIELARHRPDSQFAGIEVAPLPWLLSVLQARRKGSLAKFLRGDYQSISLQDYDVVFAYLSPAAMPELWEQVRTQMRSGTMLLSYEFSVPGAVPDILVGPDARGASLYGWYIR